MRVQVQSLLLKLLQAGLRCREEASYMERCCCFIRCEPVPDQIATQIWSYSQELGDKRSASAVHDRWEITSPGRPWKAASLERLSPYPGVADE